MPPRVEKPIDATPQNIVDRLVAGKPNQADVAKILIAMGKDIAQRTNRTVPQYLADLRDKIT